MRTTALSGAIALFVVAGASHATEYVANGGFETGNFSGWSLFGETHFIGVDGDDPHSGLFGAHFGPIDPGGADQTLAIGSGATVTVSFWLQQRSDEANTCSVTFDGSTLVTLTDVSPFSYTHAVFSGVLVGASNPTLSFEFTNPPSYWDLDDVSVSDSPAIPLPSAAGLGMSALAALAAKRRRR